MEQVFLFLQQQASFTPAAHNTKQSSVRTDSKCGRFCYIYEKISSIFEYAIRLDMISTNLCTKVKIPRIPTQALTVDFYQ